jgi:AcrR family transcriptional regulator
MRQLPAKLAAKVYGAADLIAERGITDAKIDDIAEATGIPVATLYYYFRGKEEILTFLLGDLLESIAGAVGSAISQPGTSLDRLRWAVEAQMRVMLENPAACRALVGDLGRATRLPELATALDTAFHRPLSQLLTEGVVDGSLREVADPGKAALTIFGAITVAGLTGAVTATDHTTRFIEDTSAAVCDLLLDGLRPRAAAG